MAWIESHQQLERHPKTHELMRLMGWDAPDSPVRDFALDIAIGKLHRFWYWCLEFRSTGDLTGTNDSVIARSVGLAPSDGARFVDAMVESCWIDRSDGVFRVHDWIEYAGRYLKDSKFRRNKKKKRELRDVYRPRTVREQSALPYLTLPNQTKEKENTTASGRDPPDESAAGNHEKRGKRKSPMRELTDHFTEKWLEKYRRPYPFKKLDGIKCSELLEACGGSLEDAKAVIDRYLNDEGEFYHGHPIALLTSASQLPKFLAGKNANGHRRPLREREREAMLEKACEEAEQS